MTANLQNPIFTDETKAREWLEARVWPNGPVCPHCGSTGDDVTALQGKAHRPGLYQCAGCREQFTVTVKTVFERSKVPLSKWLAALFMMTASKKGVSAHQIHRSLQISYKTAWFLCHRLREAMRSGALAPMGGSGKIIEIDETLMGRVEGAPRTPRWGQSANWRNHVLTLVERDGSARSFHISSSTMAKLFPIIRANIDRETTVMTDELPAFKRLGNDFAKHEVVNHTDKEYVRANVTTNTVEGYFSIFKRGMRGTYQHCSEKHLHRYLAEFDFRYNHRIKLGFNDLMRAEALASGIKGKRLTYRRPHKSIEPLPY
jgi:transposase-like protein